MTALLARTEPLGPAFDLLGAFRPSSGLPREGAPGPPVFFFERAGLGVAGVGGLPIPSSGAGPSLGTAPYVVREALEAVRTDGEGPGPVVAGAFPFEAARPGSLWILGAAVRRIEPAVTWRVTLSGGAGDGWPTDPADGEVDRISRSSAPGAAFEEARLRPDPEPDAYADVVREAVRRIRSGRLGKVVLARSLSLHAGRQLDARPLLARLRAVDPDCYTFAVPTPDGVLVGASPELLVARSGDEVRAAPLAGSAPRFGDPERDAASGEALLASPKEREEHAITADAVARALEPRCDSLERDLEPILRGTANVWHLSTRFRGRLRTPAPSVLELVASLHPTPAVCGMPRDAARAAIAELEGFDRGWYAGPVGWVDASGDGEWAIALRCAELRGATARLFAGAGIVAGSDPALELDETERKFRALLDSLRWG